jgi:hypothetical protein
MTLDELKCGYARHRSPARLGYLLRAEFPLRCIEVLTPRMSLHHRACGYRLESFLGYFAIAVTAVSDQRDPYPDLNGLAIR